MYNPYAHAAELGVEIYHKKFSGNILGYYDHEKRAIHLSAELDLVHAACVLAHELVHAIYEDSLADMKDKRYREQAERRCDHIAANNLMPENKLIEVMRRYENPEAWYETMCVMPWVLRNYLDNLTPRRRAYLEEATGRKLTNVPIESRVVWTINEKGQLVEVQDADSMKDTLDLGVSSSSDHHVE